MSEKYFVHKSSFVDDNVIIGEGTKIWHFCHIQKGDFGLEEIKCNSKI